MKKADLLKPKERKKNHSDSLIRAAAWFPQGKEQTEEQSERGREKKTQTKE